VTSETEDLFEAIPPPVSAVGSAPQTHTPYIPVQSDTLDLEMLKGNVEPSTDPLRLKKLV
jgi:hypothetical protein